MNRTKRTTTAAIAALTAITLGATTFTADARTRVGAPPTVDNQGDVKNGDDLEVALALDSESEAGDNNTFGSATPIDAPNDDRFAIRGALSKSTDDGMCRDVDFFFVTGLAPDTEYQVIQHGEVNDKMTVGWFNGDGSLNSASDPLDGKISMTTTPEGDLLIGCSADNDGDFNGAGDGGADPHGLCGDYHLILEVALFADINSDAAVNVNDVRAMLAVFGNTDTPAADLDNNGIVDSDDLRILADLVTDRKGRRIANKQAKKAERAAKRQGLSKAEVARNAKLLRETPIAKDTAARGRR